MEHNLLGGPPPTTLPEHVEGQAALDAGVDPVEVAARFPAFSTAWADLCDRAFVKGNVIDSYAYARVGYHRGLDQLRRAGWKGHGPVPWEHEPNRGFLRSLHGLARAAAALGESDEAERCRTFLKDSSPTSVEALGE